MRSFPININKKSVLSERIFFRKKGILEKKDGYQYGLEPGMKLLKKAKEYGVEELTYYGFTTDNCKRPKEQFDAFQSACVEAVEMLTQEGGGMRRLSGFLPMQSVYADFYVEEHLWPDYSDADFEQALEWYNRQDVTLGG